MLLYTIIAGDSQTHIISNLGLWRRLSVPSWSVYALVDYKYHYQRVLIMPYEKYFQVGNKNLQDLNTSNVQQINY